MKEETTFHSVPQLTECLDETKQRQKKLGWVMNVHDHKKKITVELESLNFIDNLFFLFISL